MPLLLNLRVICPITEYEDGKKLLKSLSEACHHLSEYNKRLSAELADRQIVQKKLAEYTTYQKYMLALTEDRLEVRSLYIYHTLCPTLSQVSQHYHRCSFTVVPQYVTYSLFFFKLIDEMKI